MKLILKIAATTFWGVCSYIMFYGCMNVDMSVPHAEIVAWLMAGVGLCGATLATLSAIYVGND